MNFLLVLEIVQTDKDRRSYFCFVFFACLHFPVIKRIINYRKHLQMISSTKTNFSTNVYGSIVYFVKRERPYITSSKVIFPT